MTTTKNLVLKHKLLHNQHKFDPTNGAVECTDSTRIHFSSI